MTIDVKVPDIGDFDDVPVIGVLVSVGDTVAEEDPLIELESDKATLMERTGRLRRPMGPPHPPLHLHLHQRSRRLRL